MSDHLTIRSSTLVDVDFLRILFSTGIRVNFWVANGVCGYYNDRSRERASGMEIEPSGWNLFYKRMELASCCCLLWR